MRQDRCGTRSTAIAVDRGGSNHGEVHGHKVSGQSRNDPLAKDHHRLVFDPQSRVQAEIYATDQHGQRLDPEIGTIGQSDDGTFWYELFSGGKAIRIPLSELERAIALAREGVHSESFYDGLAETN